MNISSNLSAFERVTQHKPLETAHLTKRVILTSTIAARGTFLFRGKLEMCLSG